MATAGLNGLAWWWFAMWYRTVSRSQERGLPLQLFDGAVGLLVVASIGALLRGVVDAVGLTSRFARQAPIHAFLDVFSDGWFLLAVLGLAWSAVGVGGGLAVLDAAAPGPVLPGPARVAVSLLAGLALARGAWTWTRCGSRVGDGAIEGDGAVVAATEVVGALVAAVLVGWLLAWLVSTVV